MAYAEAWADALRSQAWDTPFTGTTERLLLGWSGAISSMQEHLYLYIPLLTMGLMSQRVQPGIHKITLFLSVTNKQIIFREVPVHDYLCLDSGCHLVYLLRFHGFYYQGDRHSLCHDCVTGNISHDLRLRGHWVIHVFVDILSSCAAVGTLAILASLNYIGNVGQDISFVRDITYWLSISGRADTFFNGLIGSEDLLYFLLVIALFITLSIIRLQSERTKRSVPQNSLRYGGVILMTLVIGYLSARPVLRWYYDATEMKDNTLTQKSIDVMKNWMVR